MSKLFDKKIVAITGAAGGIGQELSRHFGREGAIIYAIDKQDEVNTFAIELAAEGITVHPLACDISDAGAVAKGLGKLMADFGDVDILVNNAGFSEHPTIEKTTPADWAYDINGNLNGAYNCVHAVLPGMKKKGKAAIVTIGSVNALYALGDPAYSAAKAALISMTKAIAMENGRYGIRANIVLPGTVRTPIWNVRAKKDPEVLKTLMRWYPLARIAEPSDVANAVAFLASDSASAITGIELPVDCGLTAGNIVMSRELTLENF
jgi:NAD(P)-dependent dehydrogenase (short-subunit alcohol dehydrogenase family)